jgi:hypothetical protein
MKKKRDRAYYRERLAKEHPALYAKVRSGELSVHAASAKAGLIHLPSRVDALKREWKKANNAQQIEFEKWIKAAVPKRAPKPIADPDGHLRSDVKVFLSDRLKRLGWTPGRLLREIGFKGGDWTLSSAILNGTTLRSEVIPELSAWLAKEGFR